jgi:hypothetical protein
MLVTRPENLIEIIYLCRDCRWCRTKATGATPGYFDVCDAPSAPVNYPDPKVSLVTGKSHNPITVYCEDARAVRGFCGPSGAYYEPRGYPRWLPQTVAIVVTLFLIGAAAWFGWMMRGAA